VIRTANLTHSVSRNAGGLFESVRRLVQSLADTGMEVSVFGSKDEHTAADIGAWSPVKVQAFRPIGPHQFGYSPQFRRALAEFSPDLIHTHGLWAYSSVVTNQYRRRRGVPYVISAHGMLDPWAVNNSRWKKAVAHFFYEGVHLGEASCLRALCQAEAVAIRQLGLKNPIAIIPNGIDLPVIPKAEMLKTEMRKWETGKAKAAILKAESTSSGLQPPSPQGGEGNPENRKQITEIKNEFQFSTFQISDFAGGRKVLLYLGRIHPKKGLVNLLKAWAAANRKSGEWILAIAGWDQGGHEKELRLLSAECGITDSVQFLGPKFGEEKAALYRNCDAFVLPSVSEGLPMVILEAWAYGKPAVMTPECNLPDGFAAGAAWRIETEVASIQQGLDQLFRASPADLDSMGANGRRLVQEKYAWPGLGREMAGLYEWLLGGGTKPDCIF
jgi:poly(glycerol-phosphate) alpha-glucosyltransferase